jgi:SAM-dependent methyltransferase
MLKVPKSEEYYDGFNEFLFRQVPARAAHILEIGCATGRLGYALKQQDPSRKVTGIERDPAAAEIAKTRLDEVIVCDLDTDFPNIEASTIDCVIFGDVLEHLYDPESMLQRARRCLTPAGLALICVPNIGHFSVIKALLRADLMYQPSGILDATHIRFFSHATFVKMLLDVGFVPDLVETIGSGGTEHVIPAATPLLDYVRVPPARALQSMDAYQYVFAARPLPDIDMVAPVTPITFVVCVNDDDQLNSNLLRSPCLWPGSPHEILIFRNQRSAADGFNAGLKEAANDLVVLVHQDMYLPLGWDRRFIRQVEHAEREYGSVGVLGVFGVTYRGNGEPVHHGRVVDRFRLLDDGEHLPAAVDGLDEIVLALRRESGLRADPALGFHLYGTDLCLSAAAAGLTNVAVDALAFHNSLFGDLDRSFHLARDTLLDKWPEVRPLHTCMGRVDAMSTPVEPGPRAGESHAEAEIAQLRLALKETGQRLDAVLNSRTWRYGQAVSKVLGRHQRLRHKSPTG